jgi:hypothetical protein
MKRKAKYVPVPFEPKPKERTFDEWTKDLERINERNIAESRCLMVTVVQWSELKQIIRRMNERT